MELEYPIVVIVGSVIALALIALAFIPLRGRHFHGGKKIVTPSYLENDPYYKKKKIWYGLLTKFSMIFLSLSIFFSSWMLSRPFTYEVDVQDKYCRDILLCMDISTSVDGLNQRLVGELKEVVRKMKGERFGIVIFNTSPLLLVPLTDDYEFVIEQLDTIEEALDSRSKYMYFNYYNSDTAYYLEYLSAGTLVGNYDRGSSLIGDGLASCVNNFSNIEKDRPRVIIFTSDNELAGDPLITLKDAATLCALRDATVYGIGTRTMAAQDRKEMQEAVESTGGVFFLEERSGVEEIVEQIERNSEGLVTSKKVYHKEDVGQEITIFLLLSVAAMLGSLRIIRR